MGSSKICRLKKCNIERDFILEEQNLFTWNIYDKENNRIGEFEFYRDFENQLWLSNSAIATQKKGIGTSVIKFAVRIFGAIYFCSTPKEELIDNGKTYDSRYLTEEGLVFLNSLKRNKVIKEEWIKRV